MPETLPAPQHRKESISLRERLFGRSERNEHRKASDRKVGGFGLKLMMNRLLVRGHDMGRHAASPDAAIEIGPKHTARARRAVEAAPVRPALPAAPETEAGRHRPENIRPDDRRSVAGLTGRTEAGTNSDPTVLGSKAWFSERYTPSHAAPEESPNTLGGPSWFAERGSEPAPIDDPYVPEASVIRPEIPGVTHGASEPLPQRVPGEQYDPQADISVLGSEARRTVLSEEYAAYTPPDPNSYGHERPATGTPKDQGDPEARASFFGGSNTGRK